MAELQSNQPDSATKAKRTENGKNAKNKEQQLLFDIANEQIKQEPTDQQQNPRDSLKTRATPKKNRALWLSLRDEGELRLKLCQAGT